MKKRVTIRFYIQKRIEYGGYLKVCGSVPGLGEWSIDQAVNMTWSNNDWWSGEFQFEAISTLPKNNFKLETPYYQYKNNTNTSNSNMYPYYESMNFNSFGSTTTTSNRSSRNNSFSHIPLPLHNRGRHQMFDDINSFKMKSFIEEEYQEEYDHPVLASNNIEIEEEIITDYTDSMGTTPTSFLESGDYASSVQSSIVNSISCTSGGGVQEGSSQYQLNNNQSLSPQLKGISPQLIDIEYKYIQFENYKSTWESCKNHKLSFMLWSNQTKGDEEEIFIEIRDEWNGGSGIFPTLDFQSKLMNDISALPESDQKSNTNGQQDKKPYSFLQPFDPHPIPLYPGQICTFIVIDEGNSEIHSVNLVSNFFGSESQKSIRMNPITQAGSIGNTLWIGQVYAPQPMKFDYRYVVVSNNNSGIYWEKEIRTFSPSDKNHTLVINNDGPLRISDASLSWIKTGFVGLLEYNFNCSILCIVQLLYHIPALKNTIIQLRAKIGFPITQCLGNIFTSMEMGFQTTDINPLQLQIGSQDAAEIYNIITTSLLNEISTISKNTNNNNLTISNIFEGEIIQKSYYKDENGVIINDQVHYNHEKFINLILPVKGFESLEESLEFYKHTTETFDNKCIFESFISFSSLPSTLIIQLDRTDYEFKKTIKASNLFTFPKKLTVQDQHYYKLVGVLHHIGDSFYEQGHFCYYVKKSKKWFKCDGSSISISNQEDAIFSNFSNSYPFYQKIVKEVEQN
ncbi:carbohydrate-binding domain-containing protein [Tieghemostelium lacteum]|uniref:Carbohydrate-binding domain-containing protein n=1 Tax=Tieghemostelium lacteum TaxID=361077 RepID=A0A151ZDS9_TIELA|nr:carbohydrate-binding domain-containing protein [Tieghemostelium lacteum]|eukprot:KYQ92044.1 carbohydrate-binding domain-containing protein [Tieghemostelium lacteum]